MFFDDKKEDKMPINEDLITATILNNTLPREIFSEIKVSAPPKTGKVRTVYDIGGDKMILISSDNLSTHDVVHRRQVFGKGENLNAISSYYFEKTRHIISNHFIETLAPNAWLVRKARPILIEMVFRKYLTGSGWKAYTTKNGFDNGMNFCGVDLRRGYRRNEQLDQIIFTPTIKGKVKDFPIPEFKGLDQEKDDAPVTMDIIRRNYKLFGLRKPEDIDLVVDVSLKLYSFIHNSLKSKGFLLADTKWEFGYFSDGSIGLIDECVTPDSSRIWCKSAYNFNPEKNEFTIVQEDKQHFRDYVEALGLHASDKKKELAEHWMDDAVLKNGVIKYCNIRKIITGNLPEISNVSRKKIILDALAEKGYLEKR